MSFKYRKKPVEIEAWQVIDNDNTGSTPRWLLDAVIKERIILIDENRGITIKTLKGDMKATPGDWIIKGVEGELYPCKDSIFQKTYDKVEGE